MPYHIILSTFTHTHTHTHTHTYIYIYIYIFQNGARGSAVGCGTALQVGRSRVRFLVVSLEFFIDMSFRTHSASNRNKYQAYFMGVRAAGA
jgi:hypothetical protein